MCKNATHSAAVVIFPTHAFCLTQNSHSCHSTNVVIVSIAITITITTITINTAIIFAQIIFYLIQVCERTTVHIDGYLYDDI